MGGQIGYLGTQYPGDVDGKLRAPALEQSLSRIDKRLRLLEMRFSNSQPAIFPDQSVSAGGADRLDSKVQGTGDVMADIEYMRKRFEQRMCTAGREMAQAHRVVYSTLCRVFHMMPRMLRMNLIATPKGSPQNHC